MTVAQYVKTLKPEDKEYLTSKIKDRGFKNLNEVLVQFVADLADASDGYSGGSDERMYADQWLDRSAREVWW